MPTPKHKPQHPAPRNGRLKLPPRRRPPANLSLRHRHRNTHTSPRNQRVRVSGAETAGTAAEVRKGIVDVDGVVCAGAQGEGLGEGERGVFGGAGGEEGGVEGGCVGAGCGGGFQAAAGGS